MPEKGKTNIIISGEEELVIPVVIENYDEVLVEIEKENELSDEDIKSIIEKSYSEILDKMLGYDGMSELFIKYDDTIDLMEFMDVWSRF